MKIYYVDAENTGVSILDQLEISITDRVFVFSNNEGHKLEFDNPLYSFITGYPAGQNQADFYIIAHLSGVLNSLSKKERKSVEFNLLSKDKDLWTAFRFQCSLSKVKANLTGSSKNNVNPVKKNDDEELESRIFKLLSTPSKVVDLQEQLGVERPLFTYAFNNLVSEGKIKRQSKAGKMWERV